MRIGIFADIHANREALEACLCHAEGKGIDRCLFLGDLVGYGADPEWAIQTVTRYHEKGAVTVLGNHDEAVLQKKRSGMHADARYVIEWTRSRLNNAQIIFLAGLPVKAEESDRLYVHANAWAPEEWGYIVSAFNAGRSLDSTLSRLTFFGHTHEPCIYYKGVNGKIEFFIPKEGVAIPLGSNRRWLINAGAVGQPRDGNPAACYAIFDTEDNLLTYSRVPYDVEAAAGKIRAAGLPEWFGLRLERGR
jgi:diadenosine tetraphosphatase ApaH/serine/threonine PP2A family protein phosphatase